MSRQIVSSLPPTLKKLIPQATASQLSVQPRNLYETLSRLPMDGVGSRVYQTRWQSKKIGGSCYEVTRVSLKDEGKHGKAWGRLVWRGNVVSEEERIRGALKYKWDVGVSRGTGIQASAPAEPESMSPSPTILMSKTATATSRLKPSSPTAEKRVDARGPPRAKDAKTAQQTT